MEGIITFVEATSNVSEIFEGRILRPFRYNNDKYPCNSIFGVSRDNIYY